MESRAILATCWHRFATSDMKKGMRMDQAVKYRVNPTIVLREEFDDWAVLFDPDTGDAFGLDPVGVFIWKRLDGRHTAAEVLAELRANCEDVPPEAPAQLDAFLGELLSKGYIANA